MSRVFTSVGRFVDEHYLVYTISVDVSFNNAAVKSRRHIFTFYSLFSGLGGTRHYNDRINATLIFMGVFNWQVSILMAIPCDTKEDETRLLQKCLKR